MPRQSDTVKRGVLTRARLSSSGAGPPIDTIPEMDASDFQQQAVRDLAWIMVAPSLLDRQGSWQGLAVGDDTCQRIYADHLDWLAELDRDQAPLLGQLSGSGHPDSPRFRLGHYAEQLLACWLRRVVPAEHVACTVPVRQGQKTLGEFDLLWRDGETLHHWELAWKIQLHPGTADAGLDAWLGLHPADRLAEKLEHLFRVQLGLGRTAPGSALLRQRYGRLHLAPAALVKGHLFLPAAQWAQPPPRRDGLSPAAPLGWWCRREDLASALPPTSRAARYAIIPRRAWLSPLVLPRGDARALAPGELAAALRQLPDQPQLIAELRPDLRGNWVEHLRGCIVTDDWQPGEWRTA